MATRPTFTPRLESLDDRIVPTTRGRFAVGAGIGGPPRVQVYDLATGVKIADFLAFESSFNGGVSVAMGDVNNDGFPDVVVGAGYSGGPRIRIFNGAALGPTFLPNLPANVIADFFAYEQSQRGGVNVATGNFFGGLFDEVVCGAGSGGGPRVRILNGQLITQRGKAFTSFQPGDVVADFFAFEPTQRNGVNVAANLSAVSLTSFSDLAVAPGFGGAPRVRLLDGLSIATLQQTYTSFGPNQAIADFFAGDPNTFSGLSVANVDLTGDGLAEVVTGTGSGVPGVVTVFNGAAIRSQRANYNGARPGDRVDTFSPLANYSNGVSVGSVVPIGSGIGNLLFGTGGPGFVATTTLSNYQVTTVGFTRFPIYSRIFDPALFTGVDVSN